jgi:hypothetical protein
LAFLAVDAAYKNKELNSTDYIIIITMIIKGPYNFSVTVGRTDFNNSAVSHNVTSAP